LCNYEWNIKAEIPLKNVKNLVLNWQFCGKNYEDVILLSTIEDPDPLILNLELEHQKVAGLERSRSGALGPSPGPQVLYAADA
jgi:hypothetical protein